MNFDDLEVPADHLISGNPAFAGWERWMSHVGGAVYGYSASHILVTGALIRWGEVGVWVTLRCGLGLRAACII